MTREVCKAPHCRNTREKRKISFFRFPKESDPRHQKWKDFCSIAIVKPWHKICAEHFLKECFLKPSKKNSLRWDAVPSIQKSPQQEVGQMHEAPPQLVPPSPAAPLQLESATASCTAHRSDAFVQPRIDAEGSNPMAEVDQMPETAPPQRVSPSRPGLSQLESATSGPAPPSNASIHPKIAEQATSFVEDLCQRTTGEAPPAAPSDVFQLSRSSTPLKQAPRRRKGRSKILDDRVQALITTAQRRTRRLQHSNTKKTRLIKSLRQGEGKFKTAMKIVLSKVSPRFHQLLDSEFRHRRIAPRGRRWTTDEKLTALGFYHRGRRLYNYLRNNFLALPAASTLQRFVGQAKLHPGINVLLMKMLQKRLSRMRSKDVIFMWDEVSVKRALVYRKREDRLLGFADYGVGERPGKIAAHAWIGMIKGLFDHHKFPFVYLLTAGDEDGSQTAEFVTRSITALQEIGCRVRGSVCDGPPKHLAAYRLLGATPENPIYYINKQKIFAFIDPPHLVKAVRNNLLTHVFCLGEQEIKFEYVRTFAEKDKTFPARLPPKLTDTHLEPRASKQKMDCGRAYEVLSSSVAAGLYAHAAFGQLPPEASHTADFFRDMDHLADSFNGTIVPDPSKPPLKQFKVAVSPGSPQLQHWDHMKDVFNKLTFKRIKSNLLIKRLPFQDSWIMSMNAAKLLYEDVREEGHPSLATKTVNQDPLENFNSTLRSCGGNRRNPTTDEFESAFATCLINNLTATSKNTNCEPDDNDLLIDLRDLFEEEAEEEPSDLDDLTSSRSTATSRSSSLLTATLSTASLEQEGCQDPSLATAGIKKTALTLLNKLRGATAFCDLCQAATLSLLFDDFLKTPWQDNLPDLQEFLSRLEEMHEIGRRIFPQIVLGNNVMKIYKEELSKVNLDNLVFCDGHDSLAKSLIVEDVGEKSFQELLANKNQQIRSKDILSIMVQQRTVPELPGGGDEVAASETAARAFADLVADLLE